jgi:hypothetical protein
MAKVKNISGDALSLFRADAPPVRPGDVVTVRDENFVDRAWPRATWELVEAPELDGYEDDDTDDAYVFVVPGPKVDENGLLDFEDMTVQELKDYAAARDIDITGRTLKADLIEAITTPTEES